MDLIDQKLTTASLDPKYEAALRASVGIAKKTANCYYNKTDESELLCMAMTTLVKVERVFSRRRLLLSYVRNQMSAQTTRAVLCLGYWSTLGFVDNKDVSKVVAALPKVPIKDGCSDGEYDMADGWDDIDDNI
ncbi:hypothetical protein C0991_005423 [Blastosporella zonata]|nr:hypothetical protein C0991_005423 [Blastosporella zonata]